MATSRLRSGLMSMVLWISRPHPSTPVNGAFLVSVYVALGTSERVGGKGKKFAKINREKTLKVRGRDNKLTKNEDGYLNFIPCTKW